MKMKKSLPIDWELSELDLEQIPNNQISYGRVNIFEDRIGRELGVPILIAKGDGSGPILGITAAVHGNEINGIPVIHNLFQTIQKETFHGTIVAIPIVNVPGYISNQREFIDGADLNRVFPGKESGRPSEEYAFHFVQQIAKKFDYLLDLHTASFGRINSHYIRADLTHPEVRALVNLQHADIVVHTTGPAHSLRSAAMDNNIPALTIELGNPQIFQQQVVEAATTSMLNVLSHLTIINQSIRIPKPPVVCKRSSWIRCHDGGILTVHPDLLQRISKDDGIATLVDLYGREDVAYTSPEAGVVIGKNNNPVVSTGGRILHLGILSEYNTILDFKA